MCKKLTIVCAFAFFSIFIGSAVPPADAHHCKGGHNFPTCEPGDEENFGRREGFPLIATFDDVGGDNLQSDSARFIETDPRCFQVDGQVKCPYVNKEDGMKVGAGGQIPFRIQVGFRGTGKDPRELSIKDVSCQEILVDANGDEVPEININKCNLLTTDFPSGNGVVGGEINVQRANLTLAAIPYDVCPFAGGCPDVFTMAPATEADPETFELMSFRVSFGEGLLIEIASAIGGWSAVDAGRCLSLLTGEERDAFLAAECSDPGKCNVTVTARDDGSGSGDPDDEENDAWSIDANGLRALICKIGNGENFVIGQTTLTFGFDAVKK